MAEASKLHDALSFPFLHFTQGGIMWPSHATLYLVPCTAQQEYDEKITFWKNICGLDFSPLMYVNN